MDGPTSRVLLVAMKDFRVPTEGGLLRVHAVHEALRSTFDEVDWVSVLDGASSPSLANVRSPWWRVVADTGRVLRRVLRTPSHLLIRMIRPAAIRVLGEAIRRREYDVVVVEFTYLTPYRALVPEGAIRQVVDLHNIESDLARRQGASLAERGGRRGRWGSVLARSEARALRAIETDLAREDVPLSFVSGVDRDRMHEIAPQAPASSWVVATNGVDDAWFEPSSVGRDPVVVFVATLGWGPNVDAAHWLAREVWPVVRRRAPGVRLQIIGRGPTRSVRALAASDIEVVADPVDVRPYVRRASVATAPLLAAGGTRLKILEALAAGTPVVSTSLGALGLEELAGPHLRVSDDPVGFAEHVLELLAEPATSVDEARDLVEPFRWRSSLAPLVELLDRKATSTTRPPAQDPRGDSAR